MLAVTAVSIDPDDPLSGLDIGERPDPEPADGWVAVTVRAAALNHHDLWTLKGVGISEDRLPIVLGCDAAGVDGEGNEVIVHSVICSPDWQGDETRCCRNDTTEPWPNGWWSPAATWYPSRRRSRSRRRPACPPPG
jgi:D-arabinose 1-dehydrogenase-like Zn-dependent alcohol dehydrogenase